MQLLYYISIINKHSFVMSFQEHKNFEGVCKIVCYFFYWIFDYMHTEIVQIAMNALISLFVSFCNIFEKINDNLLACA